MGTIGKVQRYINTTSQAAYHYRMTKYGFSVNNGRALTGKKKIGYFFLGLGYELKDLLTHSDLLNPSRKTGSLLPAPALALSKRSVSTLKGDRNAPYKSSDLSGVSFSLLSSDVEGPAVEPSKKILENICAVMMRSEYKVLSVEEIAMETECGMQTVLNALRVMMKNPPPGIDKVEAFEDFVYFAGLQGEARRVEYNRARQRHEGRFASFLRVVGDKILAIEGLPVTETTGDVLRMLNEDRDKLGIRFLDIFLFYPGGKLKLEHRNVLPEDFYRPGPQAPEALMKNVIEGEKYSYSVKVGKDDNREAKSSIREAGWEWEKDFNKFFSSLRERGIEDLIILKALSAEKAPQAVLVVSNPVFFGEKNKERVVTELNRLAKAVGRTLGKIRKVSAVAPQDSAAGSAEASKVPAPGEAGYKDWVDRNELAISKFYDRSTKTFAHICRLSRAYQMSVVEGIDRIFEDIKGRWPGEKAISVIDAGMGTAHFLEKFMLRADAEKIKVKATAIDLSKAACAIAGAACTKFGDRVSITKGNIAKMTRFLEDADPIKPASQKLVFLNYVLQYVPIHDVLKETNRVLEKGGRVLIANFKPKKSMRWNEFWTNVRASWKAGREKKFGHGRLYEMLRYFLLFFRHAIGIIKFAVNIDRAVEEGIMPVNPDKEELTALLEKYGFKVLLAEDTHHQAGLRFYAEKVRDLE